VSVGLIASSSPYDGMHIYTEYVLALLPSRIPNIEELPIPLDLSLSSVSHDQF
jgi:hypothetical protein